MSECNNILGNPAVAIVAAGYNTFVPIALSTYNLAIQNAGVLADFTVSPVQYSAQFGFEGTLNSFNRPPVPTLNESGLTFDDSVLDELRDAPEFNSNNVRLETNPTFTTDDPNLSFLPRPNPLAITEPGDAPVLPDRTAPIEPDYELPTLAELITVTLPERPDITIPEWDAVRPTVTLPQLVETWSFSPATYVSALLTKVQAQISRGLDGGTGIPVAVQDALWQRARSRVDEEANRAVDETVDEFATRGFTEPNGIAARRLDRVRQNAANQRNTLARELTIEEARLEQSNMQFYVQQGIAFEQVNISLFVQTQQLLLSAAQFQLDSSIRVFEAKIGVIRLEFDVYKADAEVFEARIRGEIAKAEVYKAEIEGAKLLGEINKQKVELYRAQVDTIKAMADFYNSRVQGFRAQVEADVSRVEAFRAIVQAYAERVRAKGDEWNGYRASIDAEVAKTNVFDSLVRAFSARVSAVNSQNSIALDSERLRVQQHEAELRGWDGDLRRSLAFLEAERSRVESVATAFDARARIYSSEAAVEATASAASDRTFQLGLERERARLDVALKDAEIRVQQSLQLYQLLLTARQSAATVSAQIAAGMASAVSFSASAGSSTSESQSCSTSYNFSGEIAS